MKWNYRLVQMHRNPALDNWVQVMETFYNDDGSVAGFTEVCLGSEYPGQIPEILQRIVDDINRNSDVLQMDDAEGFKPDPDDHTPF